MTFTPDSLSWRCCRFDELSVFELDAIYQLRQQIFSVEQQCIFVDADGCDSRSLHLAAWAEGAELPMAYARLVQPGVKYAEPSIGRVVTAGAARRTGLGRELVRRAIAHCRDAFPGEAIRIGAQARLEAFYAEAGFITASEPYIEDGIPHLEMVLPG